MSINIKENFKSLENCTIVNTEEVKKTLDNFNAETILNWLAHSHLGNDIKATLSDLLEYAKYLDAKISSTRKTLTFWDSFQVKNTASSKSDFLQKYNSLPINSSLIISDEKGFSYNQQNFKYGDLVLKDDNEEMHIISSSTAGAYVPNLSSKTVGDTTTYSLGFTYQSGSSFDDIASLDLGEYKSTPENVYSKCVFSKGDFVNSQYTLQASSYDSKPIYPMWECREVSYDSNNNPIFGEKIYDLISVQYINDTFVFEAKSTNKNFALLIK